MTPKKPKEKLTIQTRRARPKSETFAGLRRPDQMDASPVAEMLRQSEEDLDAQNNDRWASKENNLDAQTINIGRPNLHTLDAQQQNTPDLDAKTSKNKIWTPKNNVNLDAKTPKENNLDVQILKIADAPPAELDSRRYERARTTARVNLRPYADILQRIKVWCVEREIDLSRFFEQAGVFYIENLGVQTFENLDAWTPYDDRRLMMWSTRPSIISLYLAYNPKNKWKIHDDKVAAAFNETDLRLLELGFIQTQFNARFKRVNSFSYYIGGIEEWLESAPGEEMLNFLIKHHREQWSKATGRTIPESGAGN